MKNENSERKLRPETLMMSYGYKPELSEGPATMTHSDVDVDERISLSITEKLIRLSIGVEHPDDLIWDLEQAFSHV